MAAKALRNIDRMFGKSYAAGDAIPDDVVSRISPQALRALINNHTIEVEGMDPGQGAGMGAHLQAKTDQHHEKIKKLEAGVATLTAENADLRKRLEALEQGGEPKQSKRQARVAAAAKE